MKIDIYIRVLEWNSERRVCCGGGGGGRMQDVDGDCEAFISGDYMALNGKVGGVKCVVGGREAMLVLFY